MVRHHSIFNKSFYKGLIIFIAVFILYNFIFMFPICNSEVNNNKSSSIVIEAESGRILSGVNVNTRLPMASTTKVVTALIVLDHMDINKIVSIPPQATGVEGSSIYLKANEKWKILDLLYGMMLRSGNDAATALAIVTGGTLDNFSKMMNDKATSLGLTDSNFTNPHGLHNSEHYTSSYDLAMLTRAAMKYDIFKTIVSTKVYRFKDQNDNYCVFANKNKMLNFYEGANGVKTGYTKKSGRCLVSAAKRDNMQLITVVINYNNMWNDSMDMMNKAFNTYKMREIITNGEMVGETQVTNSLRKSTMLQSKVSYSYPLTEEELMKLSYKTEFNTLKAPVVKDAVAGNIKIYLDKHLIFNTNAYTIENINDKGVRDHLKDIADRWLKII